MTLPGESHSGNPEVVAADFAAHREQVAAEQSPHGPVRARIVRLAPGIVGSGIVPSEIAASEYDPSRSIMSQALTMAAPNLFGDADASAAELRMAEREINQIEAEEFRH